MEAAAAGLDEAIKTFTAVARSKNPPYPPQDIDQRAAMGRNSLAGQLARAIEAQKAYESTNAAKLAGARARREAEMRKKEEEERIKREGQEAEQRRLAEERRRLVVESMELAKRRMDEEEARHGPQDYESGEDGDKGKRKRRTGGGGGRKGKKGRRDDGVIETSESEREAADSAPRRKRRSKSRTLGEDGEDNAGADRPRKRKRLTKSGTGAGGSGKKAGKFLSAETVDSDEDLEDDDIIPPTSQASKKEVRGDVDGDEDDVGGRAAGKIRRAGKGRRKPRVEDEDDDESPLEDLDPRFFAEEEREERLREQKGVPIDPALKDEDVEMEDD